MRYWLTFEESMTNFKVYRDLISMLKAHVIVLSQNWYANVTMCKKVYSRSSQDSRACGKIFAFHGSHLLSEWKIRAQTVLNTSDGLRRVWINTSGSPLRSISRPMACCSTFPKGRSSAPWIMYSGSDCRSAVPKLPGKLAARVHVNMPKPILTQHMVNVKQFSVVDQLRWKQNGLFYDYYRGPDGVSFQVYVKLWKRTYLLYAAKLKLNPILSCQNSRNDCIKWEEPGTPIQRSLSLNHKKI